MLPRPELRDAFRRELRRRLMAEARVALAPRETAWTTWVRLQRSWGSWLRPAVAFAAIAIFLLAGSGLAAAGSLPGDPAFALKRAAEDVQLALASSDNARIEVLAAQADHRLAEFSRATTERLTAAPTASAAYAEAVAKLTAAIEALRGKPDTGLNGPSNADAARDVAERARAKHIIVLDELEQRVPAEARGAIEQAKHEAEQMRPSGDRKPENGPGVAPGRTPERSAGRTPEPTQSADQGGGSDTEKTDAPRTAEPTTTTSPTETRRPSPSPSSPPSPSSSPRN